MLFKKLKYFLLKNGWEIEQGKTVTKNLKKFSELINWFNFKVFFSNIMMNKC